MLQTAAARQDTFTVASIVEHGHWPSFSHLEPLHVQHQHARQAPDGVAQAVGQVGAAAGLAALLNLLLLRAGKGDRQAGRAGSQSGSMAATAMQTASVMRTRQV